MNFKNLIVISVLALAGCGGGGGTSAINSGAVYATDAGSAAIGAAMSNAAISIQPLPSGSNAEITLTANASGTFTVPAGTKFPALVKATSLNKQYTYYGYIKSADQVGIPVNPITTTLLALAAGGHPSTITTALSDSALSTARTNTAALFSALLAATGQSNVTDFLSKTFSTDHTGLDLILDSIGIQLSNSGVISVINKMTGAVTTVDPQSIVAIAFDQAAITQMNTLPIALCSAFLDGLSTQTMINDLNIYDANFLADGRSRDNYIAWLSSYLTTTFNAKTPIFSGIDGNNNLQFSVQYTNSSTGEYISDYGLTVKKSNVNGNCVLVGNQNPFEITIQPAIKTLTRADGLLTNIFEKFAGVEIFIGTHSDWTFTSNDINNNRIGSARVDVCDSGNNCTMLATLTNPSSSVRGVLDIDGPSANNFFHMLGGYGYNLFTDISTPLKITFFSTSSAPLTGTTNSIGEINTRASGPAFTQSEVTAISLPSVDNYTLLANYISNPALNWNSGSGVISELGIDSRNNVTLSDQTILLLKGGTGTTSFNVTDPVSPTYKSIHLSSHIPNRPGMLETKYIWAPTCPYCN